MSEISPFAPDLSAGGMRTSGASSSGEAEPSVGAGRQGEPDGGQGGEEDTQEVDLQGQEGVLGGFSQPGGTMV